MTANRARLLCAVRLWLVAVLAVLVSTWTPPALADETCNSPYMGNLIKNQEDYVYVWTLGVKGVGDGWDKLVTIDANPASTRTRSPPGS